MKFSGLSDLMVLLPAIVPGLSIGGGCDDLSSPLLFVEPVRMCWA